MKAGNSFIHDLRVGQCVTLDGGRVSVCLLEKSGRIARLRITSPASVVIDKTKTAANEETMHRTLPTPLAT